METTWTQTSAREKKCQMCQINLLENDFVLSCIFIFRQKSINSF